VVKVWYYVSSDVADGTITQMPSIPTADLTSVYVSHVKFEGEGKMEESSTFPYSATKYSYPLFISPPLTFPKDQVKLFRAAIAELRWYEEALSNKLLHKSDVNRLKKEMQEKDAKLREAFGPLPPAPVGYEKGYRGDTIFTAGSTTSRSGRSNRPYVTTRRAFQTGGWEAEALSPAGRVQSARGGGDHSPRVAPQRGDDSAQPRRKGFAGNRVLGSNGTENSGKAFSFVDSSESSSVKVIPWQHPLTSSQKTSSFWKRGFRTGNFLPSDILRRPNSSSR
jgi:hypothetical protein